MYAVANSVYPGVDLIPPEEARDAIDKKRKKDQEIDDGDLWPETR